MSCFTVAARKKKGEGSGKKHWNNLGAFLAPPCVPRFNPEDRIQAMRLHHASALPSLLLGCPVFSSPHVNPGTPASESAPSPVWESLPGLLWCHQQGPLWLLLARQTCRHLRCGANNTDMHLRGGITLSTVGNCRMVT